MNTKKLERLMRYTVIAGFLLAMLGFGTPLLFHSAAQQTNPTNTVPYSCIITISSATTTQCQAIPAAGLRNYVQSYQIYNTTAGTANTFDLTYGTGANCATGQTALTPLYAGTAAATVNTSGIVVEYNGAGFVPPIGNAICVTQAVTTTASTAVVTVNGYVGQ